MAPPQCSPPKLEDLWTLYGKHYDLRDFVARHPGGRAAILMGQGRDCTELFESYHLFSDAHKALLSTMTPVQLPAPPAPAAAAAAQDPRKAKGSAEVEGMASPFDWSSTPFYDDLRAAVREFFRGKRRSPKASWWAVASHLVALLGCAVTLRWWLRGEVRGLLALPVAYWISASKLLHDGSHFALSRYPAVNSWCARAGFLHCNLELWNSQHCVGHHCYTNIPGHDPDLNHFLHEVDGAPGYRLHPSQPYLPKYRFWPFAVAYQSLATTQALSYLLVPQFLMEGTISGATRIPPQAILGIVLERLLMAASVFLAARRFSPLKAAAFVLIPWAIHGILFYVFSQISHCNQESLQTLPPSTGEGEEGTRPGVEWAKWQVQTALDYNPSSWLWGVLSVGLNQQILHHLMPTVNPCHYPDLHPVVRSVAAAHGLDYASRSANTFTGMLRKYIGWVSLLNSSPDAARGLLLQGKQSLSCGAEKPLDTLQSNGPISAAGLPAETSSVSCVCEGQRLQDGRSSG